MSDHVHFSSWTLIAAAACLFRSNAQLGIAAGLSLIALLVC